MEWQVPNIWGNSTAGETIRKSSLFVLTHQVDRVKHLNFSYRGAARVGQIAVVIADREGTQSWRHTTIDHWLVLLPQSKTVSGSTPDWFLFVWRLNVLLLHVCFLLLHPWSKKHISWVGISKLPLGVCVCVIVWPCYWLTTCSGRTLPSPKGNPR